MNTTNLLNDAERLHFLKKSRLMDSPPELAFDRLTRMASKILHVPVALISLVDDTRQFFKSSVGLEDPFASERMTPLTHSFCKHVVETGGRLVINDAANDPLVKDNLAVAALGVAAYAGVPIKSPGGLTLGSFCVIDTRPRGWTHQELELLTELTELCMAEIAMRDQRAELDGVLNCFQDWMSRMPVGAFMCDPGLRISGWNPIAEKIFGYTAAEVEGRTPQELLFRPDEIADAERRFMDMALATTPARSVTRCVAKDGGTVICSWTATVLSEADGSFGGFIAMVEDCTAQMRVDQDRAVMETQMRESEERFRQLAQTIREVFWMSNVERSRVFYVSPRYEEIWGRTCDSLYRSARSWEEAIHPDDRERVMLAQKQKLLLGRFDEEFRILRPDGSVRWIREQAFPVNDGTGLVSRIAGVSEDITQRKKLEEQLRQSQKMDAIGQLAGGVAHDFNNILTVIHGNASLLLETQGRNSSVSEFAHQIVHASERAAALTRQLLLLSRKQVLHLVNVDLNEVVNRMNRMFNRIVGEDIVLESPATDDLPAIRADVGMIEQVLLNLVVNARDAMPKGGRLQITTRAELVDSATASQFADAKPGHHIVLSVVDSGTGISTEDLPHIFEPFFTTKEAGKGTGLGLATVYGIVKQHHGWVTVQSAPGEGTTFRIYLPVAHGEALTLSPAGLISNPMPRGNETLLVVEDEEAVRELISTTLERCGYKVLSAATGREALDAWQRYKDEIQLLLADVVMPDGMTGVQLGTKLSAENPAIKIIYTSGHGEKAMINLDADSARVSFIQKPYSLQQVAALIRTRLDEAEARTMPVHG